MNTRTGIKLVLVCLFAVLTNLAQAGNMLFTDHPLAGKIWDMKSRSYLDEAELAVRIKTANVILLGETHDNVMHHDLQQKLLKQRIEAGAPPALMMEQLNSEDQKELDRALSGSDRDDVLNRVNGLIRFTEWQFYSPLLAIAIDNKLPVVAANVPVQRLQPAIWRGFDAYDAEELKRLAVERVWSEERQNYLVTHMGGAHCGKIRDDLRAGLTRSQRLRDAYMADSAVGSVGRGIVAIVGRDHARRDIGLPLYFAARTPSARILSIGMVEVAPDVTDPRAYEAETATGDAPYDVIWFTPRADRVNPCGNFGKSGDARQ